MVESTSCLSVVLLGLLLALLLGLLLALLLLLLLLALLLSFSFLLSFLLLSFGTSFSFGFDLVTFSELETISVLFVAILLFELLSCLSVVVDSKSFIKILCNVYTFLSQLISEWVINYIYFFFCFHTSTFKFGLFLIELVIFSK